MRGEQQLMTWRGSSQRLKFDDVKSLVESRNFELLDNFYINTRTKMNLKCQKNHVFAMSVDNIRKGCNCPKCIGVAKPTLDEIRDYVNQFNYELIDEVYINNSTKLNFRCENNHIYSARWCQFKRGQRCPYCKGNKKYSIEEVEQYITSKGYQLVSKEYKGAHMKLELICPNQHEYMCSFHNFLSGKRCSLCNKISKGEEEIKKVLNELNINFKFQYVFHDCKRIFNLPFDFYLEDYNIAIEYDGEQHFHPVDFAGKGEEWANEQLMKVRERDAIKDEYCRNNNIKLIRIPYYEFKNIKNIITNTLK